MPQAKVFKIDGGTVGYRCLDASGDEIVREFWVAPSGGAVHVVAKDRPGCTAPQVCAYLSSRGPTLQSSRENLFHTIQQEARAIARRAAQTKARTDRGEY